MELWRKAATGLSEMRITHNYQQTQNTEPNRLKQLQGLMAGKTAVMGQNSALFKGLPLAPVCKGCQVFLHTAHLFFPLHPSHPAHASKTDHIVSGKQHWRTIPPNQKHAWEGFGKVVRYLSHGGEEMGMNLSKR